MEIFASVIFFLSFMSTILPAIAFPHRSSHFHINYAPKSTSRRILLHTHRRNYGLHQTPSDEQSGLFRRKNIPILGVAVGFTALCFQVLILYPWHELLRNDFTALEVVTKEEVVEDGRLEEKLDRLIEIDREILRKLSLR